jgi:hypothetical protein
MYETTFRHTRLPLRTVGVPCLRVSVTPLPAANTALVHEVSHEEERHSGDANVCVESSEGPGDVNGPGQP